MVEISENTSADREPRTQPVNAAPSAPLTPEPPANPLDAPYATERDRAARVTRALEESQASGELRDAVKKTLDQRKREKDFSDASRAQKRAMTFDIVLDRYEAKYIIPRWLVPEIREFIRPFCDPDPNGRGDPPEYVITTMQLDSPDLALHHAKEYETLNRFKLRVRTYGVPGQNKIYMEVKRKLRFTIVKSRCSIPFEKWSEELVYGTRNDLTFKSRKEEQGFLDFVRLSREIGARPIVLIRYTRESYFGVMDRYARVTFDRKLQYLPVTDWNDWGNDKRWFSMDVPTTQNKLRPFSGVVLELKTLSDTPQWMVDLVQEFDLVRTGHCKYSNALWTEALFRGTPAQHMFGTEYMCYT